MTDHQPVGSPPARRRLVVVAGIPGTGKSTLAARAAEELRASLLSKDIVEANVWRNGVGRDQRSGWIAYELLTAMAEVQLMGGAHFGADPSLSALASWDALR